MTYGVEPDPVTVPDAVVVKLDEVGGLAAAGPGPLLLACSGCLNLVARKAMLLAAAKAGVNRGDRARTTVAAEGKIPFEPWSSSCFVGVEGAVGVALPDPVQEKI